MYSKSAKIVGILNVFPDGLLEKRKKTECVGHVGAGKFNYYQILIFFSPHKH